MSYDEERQLMKEVHKNNMMLRQIIKVMNKMPL